MKMNNWATVAFAPRNRPTLAKFVFKIFNNRAIVFSEFKND